MGLAATRPSKLSFDRMSARLSQLYRRVPFWLGLLVCVLVAVVFLFPFYWMLIGSFKSQTVTQAIPPEWFPTSPVTDNYRRLIFNFPTLRWTFNSFFVSAATTCLVLLFSSMAGYAFARLNFAGKRILFALLILAMMMPRQVILVPLFIIMVRLGWLNTYQGLILPLVAWPFTVFLFRQFMRTLPLEIFDAARIDGASELEIYWRIVMPLAKPALAVVAIFAFISTWNDYMWQLVMVTQRDMATLPVAISTVITARTTLDYGLGMAAATFASIPMMLVFILFQGYFIKGITMGSVK